MVRCGVCGDPGQMRCGGNHVESGVRCGVCGNDAGMCKAHIHEDGYFSPKKPAAEIQVAPSQKKPEATKPKKSDEKIVARPEKTTETVFVAEKEDLSVQSDGSPTDASS